MNSRAKGAAGEREAAAALRDYGYNVRRGQQFSGANGDADIVGMPDLHLEIKRVERLDIHGAMDQSRRDARPGEFPVVMHRKNHTKWLVTCDLDTFVQLYREWEAGKEVQDGKED